MNFLTIFALAVGLAVGWIYGDTVIDTIQGWSKKFQELIKKK